MNNQEDFFAFSDSIREIDEAAPFIRLEFFRMMKTPVALLCVSTESGEELSCCEGFVESVNPSYLEIGTRDDRRVTVSLINAAFYPVERKDVPIRLQNIAPGAISEYLKKVSV